MITSIIIRTYNEGRHLRQIIESIRKQRLDENRELEFVIVDSGSTDDTLHIARSFSCNVVHISKDAFTFGKSLNIGCSSARGEYLVFISGHCVPIDDNWLQCLLRPLHEGTAAYSYGRQIGNGQSRFSECQLFNKYFPETGRIQTSDFFCNNANAALPRSIWQQFRFNEELTGLEDMDLGKRLVNSGLRIAYVAEAPVYHVHDESWKQVRNRYEREAVALQSIMPQIHVNGVDFIRYVTSAVLLDIGAAIQERKLLAKAHEIVLFRLMQFWGSYRGNHEHRKLSYSMKEKYFYPK